MSSRRTVLDMPRPEDAVPPLQAGDRLTREEFERRWELHPEIKKAELIDGLVFLEMTVSRKHGGPHYLLALWAGPFLSGRPDVEALDNVTVRLRGGVDVQPDLMLRRRDGGSSAVSEDDCIEGPPEFIAEVAASSASYDVHIKQPLHERNGVAEYLVWLQYENRIDWWTLVAGRYELMQPNSEGVVESRVFPGLKLPVQALLDCDIARLLGTTT